MIQTRHAFRNVKLVYHFKGHPCILIESWYHILNPLYRSSAGRNQRISCPRQTSSLSLKRAITALSTSFGLSLNVLYPGKLQLQIPAVTMLSQVVQERHFRSLVKHRRDCSYATVVEFVFAGNGDPGDDFMLGSLYASSLGTLTLRELGRGVVRGWPMEGQIRRMLSGITDIDNALNENATSQRRYRSRKTRIGFRERTGSDGDVDDDSGYLESSLASRKWYPESSEYIKKHEWNRRKWFIGGPLGRFCRDGAWASIQDQANNSDITKKNILDPPRNSEDRGRVKEGERFDGHVQKFWAIAQEARRKKVDKIWDVGDLVRILQERNELRGRQWHPTGGLHISQRPEKTSCSELTTVPFQLFHRKAPLSSPVLLSEPVLSSAIINRSAHDFTPSENQKERQINRECRKDKLNLNAHLEAGNIRDSYRMFLQDILDSSWTVYLSFSPTVTLASLNMQTITIVDRSKLSILVDANIESYHALRLLPMPQTSYHGPFDVFWHLPEGGNSKEMYFHRFVKKLKATEGFWSRYRVGVPSSVEVAQLGPSGPGASLSIADMAFHRCMTEDRDSDV
ncbi:hypothetical protein EV361DRAFT_981167 [Lentinula raphanica]|nr:hypothetical protein EV361DRAFT_981167 [Lentinula raphanica]